MKGNPEERAVRLGEYIVAHKATVRGAAQAFGISKSTVPMEQNGEHGQYSNRPYKQTGGMDQHRGWAGLCHLFWREGV